MGNTIYASFADPSDAEKASGALLDHGVLSEDLSIVTSRAKYDVEETAVSPEYNTTRFERTDDPTVVRTDNPNYDRYDNDNDLKNMADAGAGWTGAAGNKVAEMGDRAVAGAAKIFGQDASAAEYDAAADARNAEAHADNVGAKGEMADAVDADSTYASRPAYTTDPNSPDYRSRTYVADDSTNTEDAAKHGISVTTPEDAGAGAVKGAGWGLGIGAVAALASLFIPGVGLVVGGGALAAALGGLAAATGAGAAAGAVTGYLKDQGVEHHVAETYDTTVAGG
jgi:hypothetical protein